MNSQVNSAFTRILTIERMRNGKEEIIKIISILLLNYRLKNSSDIRFSNLLSTVPAKVSVIVKVFIAPGKTGAGQATANTHTNAKTPLLTCTSSLHFRLSR
jgi:hypothetical protein